MTDPDNPVSASRHPNPTVEDVFGSTEPLRSASDLAREGLFEDGEIEEFLEHLHAMRRSDQG